MVAVEVFQVRRKGVHPVAQSSKTLTRKLRIPGAVSNELTKKTEVVKIKEFRSFTIGAQRGAAAPAVEIASAPDEVVEIELENGSRFWTTHGRLCDEVLRETAPRGADGALRLPMSLPLRTPARGIVGSLAIKTLRFFNIDVPKRAAEKIADLVEKRALKKPGELFRCSTGDNFGLTPPSAIPAKRPILLFLHGTASSTEGSFGELWRKDRGALREELFKNYDGNVFGFEHRTMSESPVDNAIELLSRLPKGAQLHVISHSRGGLIGELLCRANMLGGREPFDPKDLEFFKKGDGEGFRGDIGKLNKLLKSQAPRVERFVRVGCPARGTTLASERFDLYLSVLFNLIEKIPALQTAIDIFSELIMAIAKERAEPDVLPGLEAMIPNSPLICLLNRPGVGVDGELRVIAGDIEGENLASVFSTLVTDPLYLGDHDLVVDTAAMFGGAERAEGKAKYSFHQGSRVSHFRYFANEDSAARLSRAIASKDTSQDGFSDFHVHDADRAVPVYKRDEGQPQPVVFLLPGIMGSHLAVGKDRIWIDPIDLAVGGLSRLKIDAKGVVAEAPVGLAYGDFIQFLSRSHEVVLFPYDWRLSLLEESARLAEAIEKKLDETEQRNHPVAIVAHSMGGLLARAMIAQHRATWDRLCQHKDARLIMLGTPNGGSFIVPLVFTARESMVKQLAMIDFTSNEAELLEVLRFYPGLAQMIPAVEAGMDFFAPATWAALRSADDRKRAWSEPVKSVLDAGRALRNLLDSKKTIFPERMCYVAGRANATPVAMKIVADEAGEKRIVVEATPDGDGRVPWSTGRLPDVKTWYMEAAHGDMADHEPAFQALKELIETGSTDKLPNVAPASRGVPRSFELPDEKMPIHPDGEMLIRSVLGKRRKRRAKELPRTRVDIVHGNLGFARFPVMVGHYEGDAIFSAEEQLDRNLEGRLRERLRLDLYPGPSDSEIVVLNKKNPSLGAVVIGLGQVGMLSPGGLARAVARGARAYAVAVGEDRSQPRQNDLSLSVLLIGTGAGGFSIDDSVAAILRGVATANEHLAGAEDASGRRIAAIEFIELYEDRAIQAARAVRHIRDDAELARRFEIEPNLQVITRRGSRRRVSFAEDPRWWQRLQIVEDQQSRLAFNLLTDRARTQAYLLPTQRNLIDGFITSATGDTATDPAVATALFEMLIPNELKQRAPEQRDMVLIVNDAAARYPWELMQERYPQHRERGVEPPKPVSVQAGMLRQLQSIEFRERVLTAQSRWAFVVGDPPSTFVELPGAVDEARTVENRLSKANYRVVSVIRAQDETDASDAAKPQDLSEAILKKLYAEDYRMIHLAGHGVYEFADKREMDKKETDPSGQNDKVTGMVIGDNKFLTPAVIRQMRVIPELVFINCCHLGKTEDHPGDRHFPGLAANLATELIRMGVRAVIAAGWAVDDSAAQRFAEVFYEAFLCGATFGAAVLKARRETFYAHPDVNTWGAYQCYGDPFFSLTNSAESHGSGAHEYNYASNSEVIVELENLSEDAATAPASQLAEIQRRVDEVRANMPTPWLSRGDVQASLGRAYGELGAFETAAEFYCKSLRAETARAPIAAAEQWCNLQARCANELDEKTAKKTLAAVKKRLEALIDLLGENGERRSLLASMTKREVKWAKTRAAKVKLVREMRDHYRRAHEIKSKAGGQSDPYSLNNWLTAEILLAKLGEKAENPKTIQSRLEEAESEAAKRYRSDPNSWDAVSAIDAKLLRFLASDRLAAHVEEIVQEYLTAKQTASAREFRSVREQFEFLRDLLTAAGNAPVHRRQKLALEKIMEQIK